MTKGTVRLAAVLLFLLRSSQVFAQDEFPRFKIGALFDTRFVVSDLTTSWLDRSLGKTRYGGDNQERSEIVRLSQASFLLSLALNNEFSAQVHLNVDADSSDVQKPSWVELIEGNVSYRHVFSPRYRSRIRAGFFFPAISLENTSSAWTTPYTITTSAINTWIGEEIRLTGVEANLVYSWNLNEVAITASFFGNNDPAGTLLAWRGWALHDRQSGLSDRLPLPPIPTLDLGGLFPQQADYDQPFSEVDGRVGIYGAASLKNRHLELDTTFYNNRGNQNDFNGSQYAWNTRFWNFGFNLPLPMNIEILSQYMTGRSKMGVGNMVNIDFDAFYVLATKPFGRNRITVRFDQFRVVDNDQYQMEDNNNEEGTAWTLAYMFSIAEKHRLAFEFLRIDSDRLQRATLGLPVHLVESQFQTSLRLRF